MSNLPEIRRELQSVVFGRAGIVDGIIPPLLYLVTGVAAGPRWAIGAGVGSAVAITAVRLAKGKPLRFALSGLAGTLIAAAMAERSGRTEGFFLPGIVVGGATTVVIVASILIRRPFVAWTSWLARSWPLDWYWHPSVRPAYAQASWLWAAYFALRTGVQLTLYLRGDTVALGAVRIVLGWPGLLVLLVTTYVLGRRSLTSLSGPSVDEFRAKRPPPWSGQTSGF